MYFIHDFYLDTEHKGFINYATYYLERHLTWNVVENICLLYSISWLSFILFVVIVKCPTIAYVIHDSLSLSIYHSMSFWFYNFLSIPEVLMTKVIYHLKYHFS